MMYICLTKNGFVQNVFNYLPSGVFDVGDGFYMDKYDNIYISVLEGRIWGSGSSINQVGNTKIYKNYDGSVNQIGNYKVYTDTAKGIYQIGSARIYRNDNGQAYQFITSCKNVRFQRDNYGYVYKAY